MGPIINAAGFTEAPGGQEFANLQVLNDHTYCCQLGPGICAATGEPTLDMKDKCVSFHQRRLKQRSEDAKRLGNPLIYTEFGACMDTEACVMEITAVTDTLDSHMVGWAYWQFKTYADLTTSAGTGSEGFYNNDGTLQDMKVKALARTYLPYTQGVLTNNIFNSTTGDFVGSFVYDASIQEPTVLFKSDKYYYANGYTLTVTVEGGAELPSCDVVIQDLKNNYVSIQVTNAAYNG